MNPKPLYKKGLWNKELEKLKSEVMKAWNKAYSKKGDDDWEAYRTKLREDSQFLKTKPR